MSASFFAQLAIGGVDVETIANEYLHWALGTGRFSKGRRNRTEMGIPGSLTVATLQHSGDHAGQNDCSLAVRRAPDVSLLRMSHRDANDGAIFWHNVVRLTAAPGGANIEHAIVRSAPRDVRLAPRASSPRVVAEIIAAYSRGGVEPRDLYTSKATLRDDVETSEFVRHVLLDRNRGVPILVVTPSARTEQPVVDPELLGTRLRGTAMVAELSSRPCTEALTEGLVDAGFDRQFTCFDGGVRMYMPRLAPTDALYQHPLWFRTTLVDRQSEPGYRTELLAGMVAARLAEIRMPPGLIKCIQDFDRQERRRNADRVLSASVPDPAASMSALLSFATEQNAALQQALRDATQEIQLYDDSNRTIADELADARRAVAQLESETQTERMKAEALEQRLEAKQHRDVDGMPKPVRADLAAILQGKADVATVLRLVAVTWPDRIVVLDSAHRSAKKSASFNDPDAAMDLLIILATDYYAALKRDGDHEARKVFGASYSATESETVMKNKSALKRRTFLYKGKAVEMLAHLKIGVKDSVSETLRTHFHWDAQYGKIAIGYCGPHLDFD